MTAGISDGPLGAVRPRAKWLDRSILGISATSSVVAAVSASGLPWSRRSLASVAVIAAHITSCGIAWLCSGVYLIREGREHTAPTRLAWVLVLTSATWLVFLLGAAIVVHFLPDD